jgi:hypothetical protein
MTSTCCCIWLSVATGALTPINQNAIKQGKTGNLERDQTERDKSELDKAHISADPDFAQTDSVKSERDKASLSANVELGQTDSVKSERNQTLSPVFRIR